MRCRFVQRCLLCWKNLVPGILVVEVALMTICGVVSKLPADVAFFITEITLRLHGDPAS